MRTFLFAMVILLVTIWSVGFIGYGIGGIMHILPFLAVIAALLGFRLDKRLI